MRVLIFIILFLIQIVQLNAQVIRKSDDIPPPWRNGNLPKINTGIYYLKEIQGEGKSLSEARDRTVAGLVMDISNTKGVSISGNQVQEINSQSKNGVFNETSKFTATFNIKTNEFSTSFEVLDSYWVEYKINGETVFYVWTLFEVAKNPNVKVFDKIHYTTDYGFSPVLKSAIIPGWGQLSKKENKKGICILAGTSVLILGAVVSENMRVSNINLANQNSHNISARETYLSNADTWENVRNGIIATAAAVYIYNIVDAITAKGAKKYSNLSERKLNVITWGTNSEFMAGLIYKF